MIRIPAETTADELFSMLYYGVIPKNAPPEDLHATLCRTASILADHEAMLLRLCELVRTLDQPTPADPTDEEITEAWKDFQKRHEAAGEEEAILVQKAGPVAFPRFKVAGKRADGVPILEPVGHEGRRWRCRSCSWSCGIWLGPWIRPCVAECPDCGGEATYRAPMIDNPEGGDA